MRSRVKAAAAPVCLRLVISPFAPLIVILFSLLFSFAYKEDRRRRRRHRMPLARQLTAQLQQKEPHQPSEDQAHAKNAGKLLH